MQVDGYMSFSTVCHTSVTVLFICLQSADMAAIGCSCPVAHLLRFLDLVDPVWTFCSPNCITLPNLVTVCQRHIWGNQKWQPFPWLFAQTWKFGPYPSTTFCIIAPCGLRGCKNGPTPFTGRMLYKATKPGLVCLSYLSMLYYCIVVY